MVLTSHFYKGFEAQVFTQNRFTEASVGANLQSVIHSPTNQWTKLPPHGVSRLPDPERAIWIHSRIPPAGENAQAWTLIAELANSYLYEIDFYLMDENQVIDHKPTGLKIRRADRTNPPPYFQYQLQQHQTKWLDLYIKTATPSTHSLRYTLTSASAHTTISQKRNILLGCISGAIVAIILYNLVLGIALREPIHYLYVMMEVASLTFSTLINGIITLPFPEVTDDPQIFYRLSFIVFILVIIGLQHFASALLSLTLNFPRLKLGLFGLSAIAVMQAIASLFMPLHLVVYMTATTIIFMTIIIVYVLRKSKGFNNFFYLGTAYLGFGAAAIYTICVDAGLIELTWLRTQAFYIGHLWQAITLSLGVASKIATLQSEQRQMIAALKSDSPNRLLNEAVGPVFKKSYTTHELEITIMFVDIVFFSQIASQLGARDIFSLLADSLDRISSTISKHRGIVDRSIGDGVIAVFGYGTNSPRTTHANDALTAAKAIQTDILNQASHLVHDANEHITLPVRIGIHTTSAVIGPTGIKINDFTIVSSSLSLAKILENSCAPYKIALSEQTRKSLRLMQNDQHLTPILVSSGSNQELIHAYEYDPFLKRRQELSIAERRYATQLGLDRKDLRISIESSKTILLRGSFGVMQVLDYSQDGFRATSKVQISRSSILEATLLLPDTGINELLAAKLLTSFEIEIRWSRRFSVDEFHHGIRTIGMTREQKELIYSLFAAYRNAA